MSLLHYALKGFAHECMPWISSNYNVNWTILPCYPSIYHYLQLSIHTFACLLSTWLLVTTSDLVIAVPCTTQCTLCFHIPILSGQHVSYFVWWLFHFLSINTPFKLVQKHIGVLIPTKLTFSVLIYKSKTHCSLPDYHAYLHLGKHQCLSPMSQ